MVNASTIKTKIGQAYFNPALLSIYDFALFDIFAKYFWKYPEEQMLSLYEQCITEKHLDIGAGTGYLINQLNPKTLDLSLLDLSQECLDKTAKVLSRYKPKCHRYNLLEPIDAFNQFDSIAMNFVFHCVTGSFKDKGVAFKHIRPLLSDKGVLFGTTIIKNQQTTLKARALMQTFNAIGLFDNLKDNIKDLEIALNKEFKFTQIKLVNSVAVFIASNNQEAFDQVTG